MEQPPIDRYGTVSQVMHWATAVLVLVAFIYGPGGSEQRVYSPARDFDRQLHETLGLSVLALVAVRLLWRIVDTRPERHDSVGCRAPCARCDLPPRGPQGRRACIDASARVSFSET
jgi:cytochrome b561